jgi:HEAT repeat protein
MSSGSWRAFLIPGWLPHCVSPSSATTRKRIKEDKQAIAALLVRLGENEGPYYYFLQRFAEEAVNSDSPDVLEYDAKGEMIRGRISNSLKVWSVRRNISVEDEVVRQLKTYPSDLLYLISTRDRRALPILHRGLESPSSMVACTAARGLGAFGDLSALESIVRVADRSAAGRRRSLALSIADYKSPNILEELKRVGASREFLAEYRAGIAGRKAL